MADDTRQSDEQTAPQHSRGPANIMPGGTAHTAGGTPANAQPSYVDAVRTLGPEYYLNFHKRPCVRDSQLNAIPAGFAGAGLAFMLKRPILICTNWAVGTWAVVGCLSYQVCQYYRSREKDGMQQAQELMEKKRATIEARKEARRKAREEQERLAEERRKEEERQRSWGFWLNKNVKFW